MSKRKLFAIIISVPILSASCIAYAQTNHVDPPGLVVTTPIQPQSAIVPSGALHVPFTTVDLTARGTDIIIDSITVVKSGASDNEAFDDILLLDSNGEVVSEGSLDDDNTVHFTDPIYIPRDTTLRLTVATNMTEDLTDFDGQIASFTITNIAAHGYIPVH